MLPDIEITDVTHKETKNLGPTPYNTLLPLTPIVQFNINPEIVDRIIIGLIHMAAVMGNDYIMSKQEHARKMVATYKNAVRKT